MNADGLEYIFDCEVRDGNENFKLPCPFHDERTPSFLIHKDTGAAYCWGCGWHGTVVTAIRDYCNVQHSEAKKLAAKQLDYRELDAVLRRKASRGRTWTNEVQVFPESWLAPWPKKAHKSVLERGFSVETLSNAESRYDQCGGRQVFPHRNQRGALLGVAGRTCRGQDPKWLFYWGYSKGRSLYYGTNLKQSNSSYNESVVVTEGVFDVLWFQQHGIANTVGILGSKPSRFQVAELRKYDEVILALDNDKAGKAGQEKLYNSLKQSTNVRFIDWPESVNDAMDIEGKNLWALVRSSKTKLQLSLRQRSMRFART